MHTQLYITASFNQTHFIETYFVLNKKQSCTLRKWNSLNYEAPEAKQNIQDYSIVFFQSR